MDAPTLATHCKVFSTQHHWCLPTSPRVLEYNTSAENGKRFYQAPVIDYELGVTYIATNA